MAKEDEVTPTEFDKLQATRRLAKAIEGLTEAVLELVDAYKQEDEEIDQFVDLSGKRIKIND